MAEATLYNFIENLEAYLHYQRDEGVVRMEVDRSVLVDWAKIPDGLESPPEELDLPCGACLLCQTRTKALPGIGNATHPDIMFIAEDLGAKNDEQGQIFADEAGQLLLKMIISMGYDPATLFITHVARCCPESQRPSSPDELEKSFVYLREQIEEIQPKVIVGMGAMVIKGLLGKSLGVMKLRGTWQCFGSIKLMPTFHPSYLLRDPSKKKVVWKDLKLVLAELGKEPPVRK